MIIIMAGWKSENKSREALICKTEKEAKERLNKAFEQVNSNLWKDCFGQEFWIKEV